MLDWLKVGQKYSPSLFHHATTELDFLIWEDCTTKFDYAKSHIYIFLLYKGVQLEMYEY